MANLYIRDLEFIKEKDFDTIEDIKRLQRRNIAKLWLKRFIITFIIIGIGVIFQSAARLTIPHMFGVQKPLIRVFYIGIGALVTINFLSWLELLFENKVVFDINEARVLKVIVKKKVLIENYRVLTEKFRYIMCEYEGDFILDKVDVRGALEFSIIKEGQEVYIERTKDDGHYQYHFVA